MGSVASGSGEMEVNMMNIKPSAAIRKNYNQISDLCRQTGEPVCLTKNGAGDLVVTDVESFARRESRGGGRCPKRIRDMTFLFRKLFIKGIDKSLYMLGH